MTRLGDLLRQNQEAIQRTWLEAALSSYPAQASQAFARQADPFANPVGHSLREGLSGLFQALLDEAGPEQVRGHLLPIIRIRAVQAFTPAEALAFIFALKAAVRKTLGAEGQQPQLAADLARLDVAIDGAALVAFDIYVECRAQVYELRVREVKRSVSWIADKINARERNPAPDEVEPDPPRSESLTPKPS